MNKTKYFFTIKKCPPLDESIQENRLGVNRFSREEEVFNVEVDADDFIDLMQHLWDIAQRKTINKEK